MTVTSSRRQMGLKARNFNPVVMTIQFDAPKESHECVKGRNKKQLWNFIEQQKQVESMKINTQKRGKEAH